MPAKKTHRRGDEWRGRLVGGAALLKSRGTGDRHDHADLGLLHLRSCERRSFGTCCLAGRRLRRPPGSRGPRHSFLRGQLREGFPAAGDRPFLRRLFRRPHSQPLCSATSAQVRAAAAPCPGTRSRLPGHRSLRPHRREAGALLLRKGSTRRRTRATSSSPEPEQMRASSSPWEG
jgi:hypothetical protein